MLREREPVAIEAIFTRVYECHAVRWSCRIDIHTNAVMVL